MFRRLLGVGLVAWLLFAGAAWAQGVVEVGTGTAIARSGAGSPEAAIVGNVGDLYLQTNGAAGTTLWTKESGAGTNTGWKSSTTSGSISGVANQVAYFTGTSAIGGDADFTFSGDTATATILNATTGFRVNTAAAAGTILRGNGTNYVVSQTTYPDLVAVSNILYATASNTVGSIATGNSGVLVTSGTGVPSIATDIPTAVTIGAAYIYRVSGTDVSLADGGTSKSLTASVGGVVWTDADSMEVLAGTATSGQMLRSGASATPAWSTPTWPNAATTTGAYLRADGTNWIQSTLVLPNAATDTRVVVATAANTYGEDAGLTFDDATDTIGSGGTLTIGPTTNLVLNSGGYVDTRDTIQTDNYASQTTGWTATYAGSADFRYLFVDEMHAKSFIADLEQALAGGQIISKSVAMVAQAFTCPDTGTATLWVRDLPSMPDTAAFVSGDSVVLRLFTRAAGSLTIADCVGVVSAYADGSGANAGQQSWTFTRNADPQDGTMAAPTNVVAVDAIVIDYGTTGNGYYEVNAIDGAYGANSPYSQIVTWTTAPVAANRNVRMRCGNLNGAYGYVAATFGCGIGDSAAANITIEPTNGIRLRQGTTNRISLSAAGVLTVNDSGGNAVITLDAATGAEITKKLAMPGANSAIAIGATPPTDCAAGTGIWIDRTEFCSLASNVTHVKIDATTGVLTFGAGKGTLSSSGIKLEPHDTLGQYLTVNSYGFNWSNSVTGGVFGWDRLSGGTDRSRLTYLLTQVVPSDTGTSEVADTFMISSYDLGGAGEKTTYSRVKQTSTEGTAEIVSTNDINVTAGSSSGDILALTGYSVTISTPTGVTVGDDDWLGLGSAAGRIEFDDQATDEINILNANVSIGTSTPGATLSVNGNVEIQGAATTRYLITNETSTGTGALVMQAGAGSSGFGGAVNLFAHAHATKPGWVTIGLSTSAGGKFTVNDQGLAGGTDLFVVQQSGSVGIADATPDYGLDVVADINSDDCFREAGAQIAGTCASDRRLKRAVQPITGALAIIDALQPVSYLWKQGIEKLNDAHDQQRAACLGKLPEQASEQTREACGKPSTIRYVAGRQVGLIAQDVQAVLPHLVQQQDNGYLALRYNLELPMLTMAAVKELHALVTAQAATIAALEARVQTLERP